MVEKRGKYVSKSNITLIYNTTTIPNSWNNRAKIPTVLTEKWLMVIKAVNILYFRMKLKTLT